MLHLKILVSYQFQDKEPWYSEPGDHARPHGKDLEMLNVLYLKVCFVAATPTLKSNSTALDGGIFTLMVE